MYSGVDGRSQLHGGEIPSSVGDCGRAGCTSTEAWIDIGQRIASSLIATDGLISADMALRITPSAKSATASAFVPDVVGIGRAGVAGSVDGMDDAEDGCGGGVHARY